ncbi:EpsG family protein [Chromobacterium phragmitis]|uniref:EpsG family protein n=1 Tax=Chromobacterium phragmitis TaxID=2202141 RepID=A0ABV0IU05_9NEIS
MRRARAFRLGSCQGLDEISVPTHMTPYLFVFAAFMAMFLTLEATAGRRALTRTECWMLLLPLAIFAIAYAGRIGTDVENYARLFGLAEGFPLEPGFSILMIGAKAIGLDYVDFTRLLALMEMLLLLSIVTRLRDPLFFLLFYLGSFYLNFQFNAIRNSLALLIVAALYVRLPRAGLLTLLSSTAIHYSSLLSLALLRLSLSRRQKLATGLVVAAGCAIALVWLKTDWLGAAAEGLSGYTGYLEQQYESKAVYPALLLKLCVAWLMYNNGGRRFYLTAYAMLVVLIHAVSPALSRLGDLVLFLMLMDFCANHRLVRRRMLAIGVSCVLVLSSLMIPWSDCQNGGEANWCLSGPNDR